MTKSRAIKLPIRDFFISDGWLSPHTYHTCFSDVLPVSGIYAFLNINMLKFTETLLYIGMSKNISKRCSGHEVLAIFRGLEIQVWFKKFPIELLRDKERFYIKNLNPSYNLVGKNRGFG